MTGAARFTVDLALPGMLHGRILRSPWPAAIIRAIDVEAAARHPGVRAVMLVLHPDKPGNDVARYFGAPVAALAAVSPAVADEALGLIRVEYHPLHFVTDMEAAREADAPPVHDAASAPAGHASGFPAPAGLPLAGNVRGPARASRGDVARGFAEAAVIVEGEYRTAVQTHCCLEPHSVVADWQADGLTVHISTQFTAGVRHELARGIRRSRSRACACSSAAWAAGSARSPASAITGASRSRSRAQAGAPVRIAFTRQEEQMDAGNRPATLQHLRIGARPMARSPRSR